VWDNANHIRYSKLNNYEKELFAYVYWSRRRKLDFWRSLSGVAFEHELAKLFRLAGYQADVTPPSGDKGVDIVLMKDGRKGIVQCKAHKVQIGPNIVRELYGTAMHFNSDFAILASVSGFTRGAAQFADEKGIKLISLEDIIGMQNTIAQSNINERSTPEAVVSVAATRYHTEIQDSNSKTPSSEQKFSPELVEILRKMARNRVKAGITTADGLVDAVYEIVSESMPDVTKREVRDAISGYGYGSQDGFTEIRKRICELEANAPHDDKAIALLKHAMESIGDDKVAMSGRAHLIS